jgi:UDP-N-acetyl-D-glucosamine dehydrogenase
LTKEQKWLCRTTFRGYDAVLISTDHDAVDYGALAGLGIPVIDTRNAFASRGLPMDHVTKA